MLVPVPRGTLSPPVPSTDPQADEGRGSAGSASPADSLTEPDGAAAHLAASWKKTVQDVQAFFSHRRNEVKQGAGSTWAPAGCPEMSPHPAWGGSWRISDGPGRGLPAHWHSALWTARVRTLTPQATGRQGGWGACPAIYALTQGSRGLGGHRGPCSPGCGPQAWLHTQSQKHRITQGTRGLRSCVRTWREDHTTVRCEVALSVPWVAAASMGARSTQDPPGACWVLLWAPCGSNPAHP